jgi:hypothetical protein
MRTSRGAGVWLASEWLHQNQEPAEACLNAVKAFNAAWRAMQAGLPSDALLRQAETLSAVHTQTCDRYNDPPLVGQEVRDLRESVEPQMPDPASSLPRQDG